MSAGAAIRMAKMNGLGNEIVVADLRQNRVTLSGEQARAIAAEPRWHFDQLMALQPPEIPGTLARITIFNRDGSEAGACGNGMRCVGLFAGELGAPAHQRYETAAGVLEVDMLDGARSIRVEMGEPRFGWSEIPLAEPFHNTRRIELQIGPIDNPTLHSPSVVNVGNPHAVFWVDDVDAFDLARIGSLLEHHPVFPERANISLARVESPTAIRLRTWERGAGLTRACGSAACAAAVCAARLGLTERRVTVTLPGGPLIIEWRSADNRILMTGPAELEHWDMVDLEALTHERT
jgi:diaminopimelate epimerase